MTVIKLEEGSGKVVKAFGNLLHVHFENNIKQGEVALVDIDGTLLKGEVIEIAGNIAKLQVFEDISGVKLNTPVRFTSNLLEAELGPGLISSIFDGLQNPLEDVAEKAGLFLERGVYMPALDREKKWPFQPHAKKEDMLERGDTLGITPECRFEHKIMVPFSLNGQCRVKFIEKEGSYTVDQTIAIVEDEKGIEHECKMLQKWPVKAPLLRGTKIKAKKMMDTGERVIDTQFPILKGGTFCTPGPFGAGKTVLQHHLSKYSSVDLVIITACGERAGEVVEVLKTFPDLKDPHTNDSLMNRTVMICNTSSMPVAAREASVYMGATIAEYYRQMGLDVLLLADSTSRWAQAMREMSGRLEEIPGEEAFPAYLASRIAAFYERSGVIRLADGKTGSLTIAGSVSPAGGNFEEPVTQATLNVVGAFLGLSRARSDARRYPAIDPLISWSKYIDDVSIDLEDKVVDWNKKNKKAFDFILKSDEIGKRMEVVGEEGVTVSDLTIYLKGELYDFSYLQQNAFDKQDAYCPLERQIELFELIQHIFDAQFDLGTHDEARNYFLNLQSEIKNMNFLQYKSPEYIKALEEIKNRLKNAMKQS